MQYYIDYHTGAGNEWVKGTLEQAMARADEEAEYTQQDITIKDGDGREVARRTWYGVEYDPTETEESEDEVIQFGQFGHYSAWNFDTVPVSQNDEMENQRKTPAKEDDFCR